MPRKPKTVNVKTFHTLPFSEQVKEVQKMAKRANVRLKLLEDTGIKNDAYETALFYNESKGRNKNRFSEGKSQYKNKDDLTQAFSYLATFLNNEVSTLGGVKKKTKSKAQDILQADKNTAYQMLRKLPEKERIYVAQELSKQANKQLKELEDNNIDYYAYAQAEHYNKQKGRDKNRFYRGGKFESKKDLNVHIQNVLQFLKSETSSMKGINDIFNRKIETFRKKGIDIPKGEEKEFMDFIASRQFDALKQYADSNQSVETYVDARNIGQDVEKINNAFSDFLQGKILFDEVQERLGVAKWQKKLLK